MSMLVQDVAEIMIIALEKDMDKTTRIITTPFERSSSPSVGFVCMWSRRIELR